MGAGRTWESRGNPETRAQEEDYEGQQAHWQAGRAEEGRKEKSSERKGTGRMKGLTRKTEKLDERRVHAHITESSNRGTRPKEQSTRCSEEAKGPWEGALCSESEARVVSDESGPQGKGLESRTWGKRITWVQTSPQ